MYSFSRRGGAVYFRLGEFTVSVVVPPLVEELLKLLKRGDSVLVAGPHGVGKSVAAYTAAYLAAEEGAVAVDLAADTSTFAEYLKLAKGAKWAFGLFDAVPPGFYAEPEVWSEHAAMWRDSCVKIVARAGYLQKRGYPVLLVIPSELTVLCSRELGKYVKIEAAPALAKDIFETNSEVYCGEDYSAAVANLVSQWGEGAHYMAFYAAKSLEYCDEDPAAVVEKAREAYVEKMAALAKSLYAPTCAAGRRLVLANAYRGLPPVFLSQVAYYDVVEQKVRTLEKLISFLERLPDPHKEYINILIFQVAEELRRLSKPRWYVRALSKGVGPLYEEALSRLVKELERQCAVVKREVSLRTLVKAYVIAHVAFQDLAEAIVALAIGADPCKGRIKALCRGGKLGEEVVRALLTPYRLSAELPPPRGAGLVKYAAVRAEDVGEESWVEVLSLLREASKKGGVDLTPFSDYVELALARGSQITKKLALALVNAARRAPPGVYAVAIAASVELGESYEGLVEKYVEEVGDAGLLFEKCGGLCKDAVVEAAVAAAARRASLDACAALEQLELALGAVGYGHVVEKYVPHKACVKSG
ncbi:MAG: ATP-binding protein [Pyrobaculum sp.]